MKRLLTIAAVLTLVLNSYGGDRKLTLQANKVGAEVKKTMYGIFFEDINFGADGGLYAELVKNRSFEFPQQLMGWKTFGNVTVLDKGGPFEKNPHYVRLSDSGHNEKWTGLENEGFTGIGIKRGEKYRFSVWARCADGGESKLRVDLVGANKDVAASKNVTIDSKEWKRYEITFDSPVTDAKALLRIFLVGKTTTDLEHVSLFPVDTWKGRENGLRKDLAQALYDLKPGIFRFPGGCIVEGTDLGTRYSWKNSVGPVENRPLNENRWHYTFAHRFFPDYYQTYGMGFYELFQLSEDIGAEPLPIISCGLSCQFQNSDPKAHVPVDELAPYIQDALDLIEFANGDATTRWGKVRADMGHPAPFNLKYIGVGNEQWGKEYAEHFEPFVKAIRKAYPNIKIVGSAGPSPDDGDGKGFSSLWKDMKRVGADLVDEHYYRSPEWFLSQAARYDNYDRKGPKVFAGEYACHPASRKNSAEAALCEAAFMTGLERNADVVNMATYAPLFAHVDAWQWKPDLIWFDNLRSVRSANYYIQQLYGHNAGTNVLPITENGAALTGQGSLFASAVIDANKKELIVKVANTSDKPQQVTIEVAGLKKGETVDKATCTSFVVADPEAENTLDNPQTIVPSVSTVAVQNGNVTLNMPAKCFMMIKICR